MRRFGPVTGVLLMAVGIAAVVPACGSNSPCRTCPPIDGTYTVRWDTDGGPNPSCPGPKVPTWTFNQHDTQITTTIGGIALGGTLYDSYDLLLTGAQSTLSYRLKAIAIPEGSSDDAGIRLLGTFTTRTIGDAGDTCESNEPFTAQRTSK
ncbi:MAG: hypothetical protein U0228_19010 [Myxococcaceae bacterium]